MEEQKKYKFPKIEEMSLIGKLTDLFWGYNIVDDKGFVMRKFRFLEKYPEKAKSVADSIYPHYYELKQEEAIEFQRKRLNKLMKELIGFTITRTSNFRAKKK